MKKMILLFLVCCTAVSLIFATAASAQPQAICVPWQPSNPTMPHYTSFTATDPAGAECTGAVQVCVPHDQRPDHVCIDDGQNYDSTQE